MIEHLSCDEKEWLFAETMKHQDDKIAGNEMCMMPNCKQRASGKLLCFSVPTRFSTALYLCERCYEMLMEAQLATITSDAKKDSGVN